MDELDRKRAGFKAALTRWLGHFEAGRLPQASAVFDRLQAENESGFRWRRHWLYLTRYEALDASVVILHILDGAMDYEAILFPTD